MTFDHVGVLKIVKELTGAQVLVHKREASYVGKGVSADVKPLNLRNKILIKFLPKSLIFFDPVEPDIIIQDEFSLLDYGVDAKVIHTHGYTAGTVSIVTAKGNAFLGCSIHGFPLRLRPGLPTVAQDIDQVISCWERVLEEGATTLHSSHGKPLSVEKMKKILKKNKRKVS